MAALKMDAPGPVAAGQAQEKDTNTVILPQDGESSKAESTTAVLAAFQGCGLYRLANGCWLLTRAGLCRELPDLRSVRALLQQIGGV